MRRLAPLLFLIFALGCEECDEFGPDQDKDACLSCHEGIERAHGPIEEGRCVTCHGGDANERQKETAHVAVPPNWEELRGSLPEAPYGFIRDFAPDQLDALDPAYLQFINPGDARTADAACGDCHPEQVANMPNSVMATNAGHYFPTLYLAGQQDDRVAHVGSIAAIDPDCDPSIPGTVCELETLVPADHPEVEEIFADGVPDDPELLALTYRSYLAKNCNTCHQSGFPRNNSPGLYRSTGCSSCHFVYDKSGTYQGDDPTIAQGTPVHPAKHEITTAIPAEQCATCHFQGGRIGLAFRGIREGGFGASNTPPNAEPINETLYGHAPGYYFSDEDTTNSVDETPPDVHFQLGMVCADCHVGRDVHGDGRIYSSSKYQVSIRCEDCHGTIREPARPDDDGVFRSYKGNELRQLSMQGDDVVLRGQMDSAEHVVPQPSVLLSEGGGGTLGMHAAMGEDADGWSHTDSLTCDTCHSGWLQYCIGCHVSMDLRLNQTDYQTGTATPGLTRGSRSNYSLDNLLLGTAPDGRVQTAHPSQQVQISVFGSEDYGTEDGELLHGGLVDDGEGGTKVAGKFREARGHFANIGFAPLFQHTTSRSGRSCDSCHQQTDSVQERERIRGVYGFGTGEFLLQAHDGTMVDGLQYLDNDGNPTTDWFHEGTGPVAPEVRERAMGVILDEQ